MPQVESIHASKEQAEPIQQPLHPHIELLAGLTHNGAVKKRSTNRDEEPQKVQVEPDQIFISGAHQHNLKHIDVAIPRNKLVVLTGVSGSGKSSLAFDTIYAEGQRRYVESLSPFVRHYLDKVEKPKVDFIYGLSPAVAIEQKTVSKNPRSNVGTITEVINYLRLLYSRIGVRHCVTCGTEIHTHSANEIARRLASLPPGTPFHLLAPLTRQSSETYNALIQQSIQEGYINARVDGRAEIALAKLHLEEDREHSIDLSIAHDTVPAIRDEAWNESQRATLKRAMKLGGGTVIVSLDQGQEVVLSEQARCALCGTSFPDLISVNFSPNSPFGMCQTCNGLGTQLKVDPERLIEDPDLSLMDGTLRWFGNVRKKGVNYSTSVLFALAQHYHIDLETPWRELSQHFRDVLLYGSGDEQIEFNLSFSQSNGNGNWTHNRVETYAGVIAEINRRFHQTSSEGMKAWYTSLMSQQRCPTCQGTRLSPEVNAVTLAGHNISEIGEMTIDRLLSWLDELYETLDDEALLIASEILKETRQRLQFMLNVGLHYLTLNRPAPTLSGGEGQRIRLASQLSCGLVGVLYVLDEPSIGLHARDQRTLIDTLLQLRDMGNTVLVVEHDEETMRTADWLIDIGPGAGILGGQVVAANTPEKIAEDEASITGRYLSGKLRITSPKGTQRRSPTRGWLAITNTALHNLKHVDARFPLGLLTCITGVSGSGKSSLVNGTLYPALTQVIHKTQEPAGPFESLIVVEKLNKVINITQEPIGRTPRSNPATYVGIFDDIRALFAGTEAAREHGYKADRFSFNVEGGRCESCKGHGQYVVEMHFLADVWVPCKECAGKRFNGETLAIRYRERNIADVLDMDVQEALAFFADTPKIARVLQTLHDVGLDYIKLGQSATTFSGGEAQRIKLAKELSRLATGRTLYILDEPTTGLHFADVQRLLDVLHRLVEFGNTVIVIEHNMDIIRNADWLIDMGPEGGDKGGYIIAEGTPEQVALIRESHTGRFLGEINL
ncbi:excinuclease ABC subunit UvrA [Ktedonospora formicarum]|uniref:UvrABC system protein A n=1 Tax=Ktedonospora formicarum TaxID=2778364 RepID=A0A8J3HUY4_9CHLR|nr:excinuclease ABC subunit UvrA [Ktedonospora formicarum]GHO42451.1 UvrABC system protein A [Ktedonospora formicarum]